MTLNPVLRAVIAARWQSTALNAHIHALIGNNAEKMVNEAGSVFFVLLHAAQACGVDADEVDMRIIRGAVNAVYDQVDQATVPTLRRASIVSGLQAAQRLHATLPRKAITTAACTLAIALERGHVMQSDFEALIGANQATA